MDGGLGSGVREDGDVVSSKEVCGEGGREAEGGVRGVMNGGDIVKMESIYCGVEVVWLLGCYNFWC